MGGIKSAVKKAASQLSPEGADHKVAILDVHTSKQGLTDQHLENLEYWAQRAGVTYRLRFDDGVLTIPEHGRVFP